MKFSAYDEKNQIFFENIAYSKFLDNIRQVTEGNY